MDDKNEKSWTVYCHENKINNKKYIGITCQSLDQRFRNGKGYKGCACFYRAIQKYGWDSFEHSVLYSGLSEEEAKQKEIKLISELHTRVDEHGYNITPGGQGYCGEDNPWYGKHHTEEARRKMSESRKGKTFSEEHKKKISLSQKGKIVSEETRLKMKESHRDVSGENNPMFGKKRDPEHMKKMVELSKTPEAIKKMKQNKIWYSGAENPNSKCVICLDSGKRYTTINEAAKDNGCSRSKVSAVCHGHIKHIKGLHFALCNE